MFKGIEAHLPIDTLLQENTGVVINTTADMQKRFQCVKETQERAVAFIQEARTKYEKASDNDLRNRYKQLRPVRTGGLVLRKTKDESVERKSKPTYEIKPYVVVATGERGNYAIQALSTQGRHFRGQEDCYGLGTIILDSGELPHEFWYPSLSLAHREIPRDPISLPLCTIQN